MRIIATLTLLTTLLLAPAAHAQDPDPARGAAARALFQEGVGLARRGDYAEAIDRFRRAQALRPAAPIAYNLAAALAHEGELVEAAELLERVLRDPSIPPQLRASAERQRDQIAPRVGRLTVRLEGDHGGVRVHIDERELPEAMVGVPVPIDPGAHEIRAMRDGEDVAHERIEIGEAERREVALTIPARVVPREALTVAPARASSSERVPEAALETSERDPVDRGSSGGGGDDALVITLAIVGGVVVAGAVTATAIVLTSPQTPEPVMGNTMPGVLTW
ncbi:tetratricopeptide repeat protein [Sandaracinus amylolyticus]|uniref:tetratricopeptide repeat protein n=1 Tax=Sandaracinus amylolyticus TaxID=927083 RepID=UPI001F20F1A4|nr:tetratricopeptide repeat protein [Sandaracinus amylolyticus]UJR78437.1 Hypothetical protein I5071_4640 [Sandaracinus amylolyticus]